MAVAQTCINRDKASMPFHWEDNWCKDWRDNWCKDVADFSERSPLEFSGVLISVNTSLSGHNNSPELNVCKTVINSFTYFLSTN